MTMMSVAMPNFPVGHEALAKDTVTGCVAMAGHRSTKRSRSASRVVSAVVESIYQTECKLLSMQAKGTKQAVDGSSKLMCDVCECVVLVAD